MTTRKRLLLMLIGAFLFQIPLGLLTGYSLMSWQWWVITAGAQCQHAVWREIADADTRARMLTAIDTFEGRLTRILRKATS